MSMERVFLCFFTICLVYVSLIRAVPLDGACSSANACDGTNILECRDGRCQCNKPWYRPCNNTCELNERIAYEGERCMVKENCVANLVCTDQRCQCFQNYTSINGICLKRLNLTCSLNAECWSSYCVNSRCQCAPGYEPQADNIRCRRKLLKIYNTWIEANRTNETCTDSSFCMDEFAECVYEPFYSLGRYCRCLPGYRVSENNERCDIIENPLLSPGIFQASDYRPFGYCPDDNAASIKAANQTTCWCRAGYGKFGDRCEVNRRTTPPIIYPNLYDVLLHDFGDNCTSNYNSSKRLEGRLCTCASDYQFMGADRNCEKIERTWIDKDYEYGLCTRINSLDQAISENGLCPAPLECEGRQDKYICSCGRDRFVDLDDATKCVNYIGRPTDTSMPRCPTRNAGMNITSGYCECNLGYEAVNENRQCQLVLSSETGTASCNPDRRFDGVCVTANFGYSALLCRAGECRCPGAQIFPNDNRTHCYAVLNQVLTGPREDCPPFSSLDAGRCICFRGYRASSDSRRCDRLALQLTDYIDSSIIFSTDFNDLDCQALFTGPVQVYSTDRCQCKVNAFVNYANDGCWHRLDTLITGQWGLEYCPPRSAVVSEYKCICDVGYETQDRTCVPKADRVYAENDTIAITNPKLTSGDCVKLFSTGSRLSAVGNYCICIPQAFPINGFTYCRFRINIYTEDSKDARNCPENTVVDGTVANQACKCKPGYNATMFSETCEISTILLTGTDDFVQVSGCNLYSDIDCQVKFGQHAFCRNNTCFCKRRMSFINADGRCEPFSNYTFPGIHERNHDACRRDEDCGNQAGVKCDYLSYDITYKVCQCKDGWLLDPKSQICVNKRCQPECDSTRNLECQGYNCVCKVGYGYNGTACVLMNSRIELDQVCNRTAVWTYGVVRVNDDYLRCDAVCGRARCIRGYRPDGSRCGPYQLEQDRCAYKTDVCSQISNYSACNFNDNTCACNAAHYRYGNICAKAVDSRCVEDEECGGAASCKGSRCRCNDRQRRAQVFDIYGRPIDRCFNGAGSISFSTHVLIALILAWTIFA